MIFQKKKKALPCISILHLKRNKETTESPNNCKCSFLSPPLRDFSLPSIHCSLTSAYAPGHGHIVAIITLQPFVVIARPRRAAILVKLCSAHLAAPAPVWQSANAWGANQGLCVALTHCWAASSHLKGSHVQTNLKSLHVCGVVQYIPVLLLLIESG